jgi:lipoate-protein ligase A
MTIEIIELENTCIKKQLTLEKRLLQEEDGSYLIINKSPLPAIVMGSSQKAEEVINVAKAAEKSIPIIQRFSAGGCVILDKDTIMVSFIISKKHLNIDFFPNTIMKWSEDFYKNALSIPNFSLQVNDYTIGDKKIGGNAQYIKKDRFVHHTSFLWDYDKDHMDLLLHPPKEPAYRENRTHHDFLGTIKPHLSKEAFIERIIDGCSQPN